MMSAMGLKAILPSLTNLPVFYAELLLLLALFSLSLYALRPTIPSNAIRN